MEAQFSLGRMGLDKEDQGLFGISWSDLWTKSGVEKIGWVEAVKAARMSRKPNQQRLPRRRSTSDLTSATSHPNRPIWANHPFKNYQFSQIFDKLCGDISSKSGYGHERGPTITCGGMMLASTCGPFGLVYFPAYQI